MSELRFRNVDAQPSDPVSTWPLEALQTALERGDLAVYRRIVVAIMRDPWGRVARRVEQVLSWSEPYGVAPLMRGTIERAREGAAQAERAEVQRRLRELVELSGMTQRAFAEALGTSASRLSTYLNGSVVPSATLMVRAECIRRMRDSRLA